MTAPHRTASMFALLAAGALLLAGCAGTATPASSGQPSASGGTELEVEAGWLDAGRQVALVTWGSSGCIPTATDVALQADGALAVTLDEGPADKACTADFAPRVTPVAVPAGVDPAQELDIVVTGPQGQRGETDLDGIPGLLAGGETDYLPSAGWVDDDLIAILTWGSSTCAPRVESVEASDRTTVAVTFETPSENQPCTRDMVPRALLVSVAGLGIDDDAATLTLTGGDAQFATPTTVPILG